jgi:hypothetical protein
MSILSIKAGTWHEAAIIRASGMSPWHYVGSLSPNGVESPEIESRYYKAATAKNRSQSSGYIEGGRNGKV